MLFKMTLRQKLSEFISSMNTQDSRKIFNIQQERTSTIIFKIKFFIYTANDWDQL